MSGPSQSRRAVVEILTADGRARIPTVGNRSIHHYWQALAPCFSDVLLPPQRRSDDRGMIWSWKMPAENRSPAESALAMVRQRLKAAAVRFEEESADGATAARANLKDLRSCVKKFVAKLAAESDTRLTAYVAITEAGPMIHSWGAAEAGRPYFPDALELEVRGTVIVGEKDASGFEVVLENRKGDCVARTKSDPTGAFCFAKIGAGSYRIRAISGRINFPVSGQAVTVEHESVTGIKILSTALNIGQEQTAAAAAAPHAAPEKTLAASAPAKRRRWWPVLAVLVLLFAAAGGWWLRRDATAGEPGPARVIVPTAVASPSPGEPAPESGAGSAARFVSVTTTSSIASAPDFPGAARRLGEVRSTADESGRRPDEISSRTPAIAVAPPAENNQRTPAKDSRRQAKSSAPANKSDDPQAREELDADPDGTPAEAGADRPAVSKMKPVADASRGQAKLSPAGARKAAAAATPNVAAELAAPESDAAAAATNPAAAQKKSSPPVAVAGKKKSAAANGPDSDAGGDQESLNGDGAVGSDASEAGQVAGQAAMLREPKRRGAPGSGGAAVAQTATGDSAPVDATADAEKAVEPAGAQLAAAKKKIASKQTRASQASGEAGSDAGTIAGDAAPDDAAPADDTDAAAAAARAVAKSKAPKKPSAPSAAGAGSAAADDGRPGDSPDPSAAARTKLAAGKQRKTPAPAASAVAGEEAATDNFAADDHGGAGGGSDGNILTRVRVRTSAWKPRLVQDRILPTQPVAEDDGESVAAMRERLLQEQAALMPLTLRQPVVWRGFAVELPAGAGAAQWRDGNGFVPEGATVVGGRAEIAWRTGAPPGAQTYTLADGAGREIARVSAEASGEVALQTAAGIVRWYWIGIERAPADGGGADAGARRFDWRLQPGRPLPAAWRQDNQWHDGRGQRLEVPVGAAQDSAAGFSVAFTDRITGWAIVSRLGIAAAAVDAD